GSSTSRAAGAGARAFERGRARGLRSRAAGSGGSTSSEAGADPSSFEPGREDADRPPPSPPSPECLIAPPSRSVPRRGEASAIAQPDTAAAGGSQARAELEPERLIFDFPAYLG